MKRIVGFAAVFTLALTFAGCASHAKKTEAAPAAAPVAAKPAPVAAPAAPAAEAGALTCTKGKETRVLKVEKDGEGCHLDYTKAGKTNSVSSSKHGVTHCEQSQEKISKKLTAAGYACK